MADRQTIQFSMGKRVKHIARSSQTHRAICVNTSRDLGKHIARSTPGSIENKGKSDFPYILYTILYSIYIDRWFQVFTIYPYILCLNGCDSYERNSAKSTTEVSK